MASIELIFDGITPGNDEKWQQHVYCCCTHIAGVQGCSFQCCLVMFHAFSCLQTTVWLSYFNDYPCTRQETPHDASVQSCTRIIRRILNLPIPGDDWDFHLTIQPLGFCNMRITCSGSSWSKLSSAWRFLAVTVRLLWDIWLKQWCHLDQL